MTKLYVHFTAACLFLLSSYANAESYRVGAYLQNFTNVDLQFSVTCGSNPWQVVKIGSGAKMTLEQANCPSGTLSVAIQTEGFPQHIYTLAHGKKFMLVKNNEDTQIAGPFDSMPNVPLGVRAAHSTDMYGNQPAPRLPTAPTAMD